MTAEFKRLISRPVFFTLVAVGLLVGLLYLLRGILAPVLLAFLVAYAFNPLVEFMARHRIPRALASGLCLLLMLLIAAGLVALIVPALHEEIRGVGQKMPAYVEKIQDSAIPWLEDHLGFEVPATLSETLAKVKAELGGRMDELAGPVTSMLKRLLSGTLTLLLSLFYAMLVPLFIFTFLRDYKRIIKWFAELIPPRFRDQAGAIFSEVDDVLAGFLRGQMIVISTLAILYSIVLSVLDVPAAITIAIVAGLFNIVPYLGTITGLLLSCLFLLLEGSPWTSYLLVSGVFVGVATTDAMFFTPKVLGNKLGLAPVIVILAILAFGEVFGTVGVLLAVPVTAVGKVLARHALDAYRRSRTFAGQPDGESDCGPQERA